MTGAPREPAPMTMTAEQYEKAAVTVAASHAGQRIIGELRATRSQLEQAQRECARLERELDSSVPAEELRQSRITADEAQRELAEERAGRVLACQDLLAAQRECAEAKASADRANARLDKRSAEYTQFCCEIADAADSRVPATAVEAVRNICAERDAARAEVAKLREALAELFDAAEQFCGAETDGGTADEEFAKLTTVTDAQRDFVYALNRAALSTPPAGEKP